MLASHRCISPSQTKTLTTGAELIPFAEFENLTLVHEVIEKAMSSDEIRALEGTCQVRFNERLVKGISYPPLHSANTRHHPPTHRRASPPITLLTLTQNTSQQTYTLDTNNARLTDT